MPTDDNAQQIAEWNGPQGQRWATLQREIDAVVAPFGDAALAAAAAQPGERVLDVGCGCGDTSILLAHAVGAAGAVTGIDVSLPMLAVARERAASERLAQLAFREADASVAELPPDNDLLFSRFGVMFFSRPAPAFTHLRRSLRSGGRCVFVCWRAPRDNPWAMAPISAARAAMGVTPANTDPFAPGPFAFADEARLRAILSEAGFGAVDVRRFDAAVAMGVTPRLAAENALRAGPASRVLTEVGEQHRAKILDAVEAALAPFAAPDGQVRLPGSSWIVTAA